MIKGIYYVFVLMKLFSENYYFYLDILGLWFVKNIVN